MGRAGFERQTQRLARPQQVALPHHLVDAGRPHELGQGNRRRRRSLFRRRVVEQVRHVDAPP